MTTHDPHSAYDGALNQWRPTGTLTIGATNPDGLVQITDTAWDSNGTMRVTVRELVGERSWSTSALSKARRLARRTLMYPEKTRSSRVIRTWHANGQMHVTFAVSRLENH